MCTFRLYYENLIPISPTDDNMELREGSNEDEDFEDCVDEVEAVDDQVVPVDSSVIPEYDDDHEEDVNQTEEIIAEYVEPSSESARAEGYNQ